MAFQVSRCHADAVFYHFEFLQQFPAVHDDMSTIWQEGLWRILLKRSKNFWTTTSSMCTISSTRKLSTKTLSSNHHKIFRYTYGFFLCEFLNIIILVGQV